jgi:hypothetical protein
VSAWRDLAAWADKQDVMLWVERADCDCDWRKHGRWVVGVTGREESGQGMTADEAAAAFLAAVGRGC